TLVRRALCESGASLWNLNQQPRFAIRSFSARRRLPPKRHSAACVEGDRSSGVRVLNGWVGNSRAAPDSCSSFLALSFLRLALDQSKLLNAETRRRRERPRVQRGRATSPFFFFVQAARVRDASTKSSGFKRLPGPQSPKHLLVGQRCPAVLSVAF